MRIIMAASLGLALAIAGCSKPTQEKTSADLKAAGKEVGAAVKDVAATPAMKAVGSDLKQGAAEAGDKLEAATDKAGEKLKKGAAKAGDQIKEGAKTAGDKTDAALNNAQEKVEAAGKR
jgi:ElaB/YqjD/DUF883 family membrane-anchored ribosome-binding protein